MGHRLVLVDDHLLFRQGFRAVLGAHPDFDVVGEASSAREAHEVVERTRPDLVVLDVSLPDADGLSVARELAAQPVVLPRVVMLTMHDSIDYVADALAAGVAGYILKDQPASEVVDALRVVARGTTYLSPRLPADMIQDCTRRARGSGLHPTRSPVEQLSAREREIFDLAVQGLSNVQLAARLGISIKTVETHRMHINRKLGVRSTAELVRLAARRGLYSA